MLRKLTFISFLLMVFIMGCSNSEAAIQTVIAPTSTEKPVITDKPIPTLTFTVTQTAIPTPTDTPTPKYFCYSIKDYPAILGSYNGKQFIFSIASEEAGSIWDYEYTLTDNGGFFAYFAKEEDDCIVLGGAQVIGSANDIDKLNRDFVRYDKNPEDFEAIFLTSIGEVLSPRSDGEDWFWDIWEEICIVPRDEILRTERKASDGTIWNIQCINDSSKELFMVYLIISVEE